VAYEVSNRGETAYLPQLNVTSSRRLNFAQIPGNCKVSEAVMICDLNNGRPLGNGDKDRITISFDVSSLTGRALNISAEVFSTGSEKNPSDNKLESRIALEEYTEIDAEALFLYRAYPVVRLHASVRSQSREIKPEQNRVQITACYGLTTTSKATSAQQQEMAMRIVIDAKLKRARFSQSQSHELSFIATAGTTKQCRVFECEVRYSEKDIFEPIVLEMHYELTKKVPDSEGNSLKYNGSDQYHSFNAHPIL